MLAGVLHWQRGRCGQWFWRVQLAVLTPKTEKGCRIGFAIYYGVFATMGLALLAFGLVAEPPS
jgi:hypothetical protein